MGPLSRGWVGTQYLEGRHGTPVTNFTNEPLVARGFHGEGQMPGTGLAGLRWSEGKDIK